MNLNKLATTTILLLILILSISAASAASVSIEDANASVGSTTTVQIMAYGVTNLNQFGINLSYNPSVVMALSAENNPNLPDDFSGSSLHDFSHASEGYVLLGSNPNTATPESGDVLLTTVTLQAEGGDSCELGLTITTLKDSDSADITLDSVINGAFTVDTIEPPTLTWQVEPPASVTQGDNVTFRVGFSESADYYFRIVNSTDDVVWRYPTSGTNTAENPTNKTWETTTDTPPGDYTIIININGVDNADNRTVTVGSATSMTVTADPISVINNTATDVIFNVTSDGSPVDGALVTLSGCGVDTNGTTGTDGTVTISVTATSTGAIDVTVTKDGYDDAMTTVVVAEGVVTNPIDVAADPTSVVNGTTTAVTFNVTSEGTAVEGALVTLLGCGVDTSGTTVADGTVTISVTANATGTIGVTATKTGYDEATTGVDVNPAPTNTYYRDADGDDYGNASDSTEDCTAPAGYVTNNTDCDDTDANVNPGATEVRNGIDDDCDGSVDEGCPTISYATLSPNVIQSDGIDTTILEVLADDVGDNAGIASVIVNLSAIGGPDKQTLTQDYTPTGVGTWTTTINTTHNGTFVLPVTSTDADGNSATADVALTAGPNTYTLSLKQGWNMIALPCNVAAVGIDTTQKLGDLITDAGEDCYYIVWFDATLQEMVADIINPPGGAPQGTTYPIIEGQGYFILVADDLDVVVAGTQW